METVSTDKETSTYYAKKIYENIQMSENLF